jgi:hypothetical protein
MPKISLIILVDDDAKSVSQTIKTFNENTNYHHCEIYIIGSEKARIEFEAANAEQSQMNRRVSMQFVVCEQSSEAERYNYAASQAHGEVLCFVDGNLKPKTEDWLTEMLRFACQKEIGAVGAKLLYTDESVLHGGLIIGANEVVGVAHHQFPRTDGGNFGRAQVIGNFSAVSISCLVTSRGVFQAVGGFDGESFPSRFFDVDYCLKLSEKNLRIVFTPYAELIKVDLKKQLNVEKNPTDAEKERFAEKWKNFIERDPFYNPNLSKKDASFSIDI